MRNSAFAAGAVYLCLLLSSCGSNPAPVTHDASNVVVTAAPNGGSASSGADFAASSINSKTSGAGGASASPGSSSGGSPDNRWNSKSSPAGSIDRASKASALVSVKPTTSARVTTQVSSNDAANASLTSRDFNGVYDMAWSGSETASASPSDPKADVGYLFWKREFAYLLWRAERETVQTEKTVFSVGRVNMPLAQERQAGFAPCARGGIFRMREATIEYDPVSQAVTRLDLTTESTDLKVPNGSRTAPCRLVMVSSQVVRS